MTPTQCIATPAVGDAVRPIIDHVLCAGTGDKNTCRGDSGGPLMCGIDGEPVLVGIVSFSAGLCGTAIGSGRVAPTVFTKVSDESVYKFLVDNLKSAGTYCQYGIEKDN